MTIYYKAQSHFFDATRWMFLYGRATVLDEIDIRPGDRVLEIGCGTGTNFDAIQRRLRGSGEVLGLDCAKPMLEKAAQRIRRHGWKNVRLIDVEYGKEPITRGRTDVVVFSYSLSMISYWKLALACAHCEMELRRLFDETAHHRYTAWAGLWSFYLFVGMRRKFSILQEAA
jgi:SAM-dependent methyltransferase